MPAAVVSFIGSNLVAIGSALGAGAASAGVAMAVGAAAVVAGAVAAQKLISELYSVPNIDSDRSRQATVRGTVEPQKLIYGEALVSGPISFVGVAGTDNRDLYHAIVLAGHPSDSISDIYFDDERIQSAHINASGNVTTGTFGPKDGTTICVIRKLTGSQTTADSVLDGAFSTINSSEHIGTNLTYIVTKFTLTDKSQETWDKFLPNDIKALVKGKKVYDPRQDSTSTYYDANVGVGTQRSNDSTTWEWSENPVWCLVDYLTDDRFGMGIDLDRIDLSKAVDAADICDATVSVPGGSEKRYTCNGVVFGTSTHKTNINKLLSSMNGMLTYTNGKYVIRAGAFEAVGTGMTLTEDHMTGPVRLKTSFERNERFNTITGTFIDPSKNYKEIEFPKVQITSALTRDNNEELTRELKLSMTNSRYMAQRIAHKLIQLSDLQKVLTFPTNLAGVNISVGDRVNVTLSEFGYTNKTFVCLGWTLSESGTGGVNLTLREDDSSSYADLAQSGYSTVTPAGGIQQGFFGVPDPSGLSATAHVESIELDWTNPANMTGIIAIEVFASPNSSWSSAVKIGETLGTQFIHDESNGVDAIVEGDQRYYWVRARRFPSGEGSDAVSDRNPDSDTSTVQATKGALGDLASQDTVGDGQIDDNAVGNDQIADGAVDTDQIATDAITEVKIEDGAITADKILANTITASELNVTNILQNTEIGTSTEPSLQLNYNAMCNLADANGKPDGLYPVEDVTNLNYITLQTENSGTANEFKFIRIDSSPAGVSTDTTVSYAWKPFAVDSSKNYKLVIRYRAESQTSSGLYLRFNEYNQTSLSSGKTHIGLATSGGANTQARTSFKDLVSNGATPPATFVEETYLYQPTSGAKLANFTLYNWSSNSGYIDIAFAKVYEVNGDADGVTILADRIYQGAGNYENQDTGFYLDSTGQFSLKDKLSFNGTTLSVSGAITATSLTLSGTSIAKSQLASGVQTSLGLADSASQVNKGLALLLNQTASGSSNAGEAALVGLDKDGVPELDTDGFIVYNGNKITIPHDEVAGYNLTIITAVANKRGFICFDANKTRPFQTGLSGATDYGDLDIAFVWKEGDQWYYDQNASTGVSFTPSSITGTRNGTDGTTTPELVAIGWLETSTSDVILTGGLFEPIALESAPFAGDTYNSGTIGGISIDGSKLYQGTGTWANANTGFYLDDTGKFSLKDKLFFNPTNARLTVAGNVTADTITVNDQLEVFGPLQASALADGTVTREHFSQDALDFIFGQLAPSVGGSNGDYKEASGNFTGSGGTVTVGSTSDKFDHGTLSVDVEFLCNHYFFITSNPSATDRQVTLNFEVSADGTFTDLTSATKTHTLEFFEYDLSSYYGYTYFVVNFNGEVTKTFTSGSGNDIPDDTDVIFRVRVTGVGSAFSGQTVPFTVEANEGLEGVVSTGGNADTLDNLDSTAFLRSNTDDTFDADLTITGALHLQGDLNITGDLNSYNVTDLDVSDRTITVNSGGGVSTSNGAGLIIDRGTAADASITWDETNDRFDFTNPINVTGVMSGGYDVANFYSGATQAHLNVGRSSAQRFNFYVTDGSGYIRYYQDESDGTNHSVYFEIQSSSSGTNQFNFNKQINVTGQGNSSQWNTAYGWGNHASAGYLTAEADTLNTVTGRGSTTTNSMTVGALTVDPSGSWGTGIVVNAGDTNTATGGAKQLVLSYGGSTSTDYAHSIRTRHDSGASATNTIEFWLWNYGTDSSSTIGTLQSTVINSSGVDVKSGGYLVDGTTVISSSGAITAPTLRLTGTSDASLSSTAHAFQVGASTGNNIIMDVNEIMARSNGSAADLHLNADGGNITFRNNGNGTTNLVMNGQVFLDQSRNATLGTISSGATTASALIKGTRSATSADVDYLQFHMPSWSGHTSYLKSLVWHDGSNNIAAIGAEYDGSKTNIHFHSQYNSAYKGTSVKTFSVYGNGNVNVLNNFLINGTTRIAQNGNATLGTITSTGTSSFGNFRLTDSSKMGFGEAPAGATVNHTAANNEGIFWHSNKNDYYVARTSGAWSSPNYQQLRLDWATGIELDGGSAYGKSGVTVTESDLLISNNASDPTLKFVTTSSSRDPVLQMNGQGGIASEGFEIWYDNSVGDVHLHTTYNDSAAAIRFHTRTAGSKATSNERFTITGDGHVLLSGDNGFSPYMSRTNTNTLNAGYNWDTDSADLWINYRGYQDGTTRFRDFRVGNGKNVALIFVDGSTREVDFQNSTDILVGGTTIIDSARNARFSHLNVASGTTEAEVDVLLRNRFYSPSGATGRILNWYSATGGTELYHDKHGFVFCDTDTTTGQPARVGLALANSSTANNVWSPAITFGGLSTSGGYQSAGAAIAAKLPSASDTNFRAGDLHFFTSGTANADRGLVSKLVLTRDGDLEIESGDLMINGATVIDSDRHIDSVKSLVLENVVQSSTTNRLYQNQGTLYWDGAAVATSGGNGVVRVNDGDASAPSFSFTNDTDTGMYSDIADGIRWAVGGSAKMSLVSTGLGVTGTVGASAGFKRGLTQWMDASGNISSVSVTTTEAEYGQSLNGNFGQWLAHSRYNTAGFDTDVDYWGWNFIQGQVDAPVAISAQWYRNRVALGDSYGHGVSSGDYWLEMAYPRYGDGTGSNTSAQLSRGTMWVRTCESGTLGSWSEIGGNLYNGLNIRGVATIDTSRNATLGTISSAAITSSGTITGSSLVVKRGNTSAQSTDYLYVGGNSLDSADAAIYLGNHGGGSGYGWRLYYHGTGSGNNNDLSIQSENLGSPVNALRFKQDGSATFAGPITATGEGHTFYSSSNSIKFGRNANENIQIIVTDNTNKIVATQDSDGNSGHDFVLDRVFNASTGASNFNIQNAGTTQLQINKTGDVGIGTSSNSSYKLTVSGHIHQSSGSIYAFGDVVIGQGGLLKGTTTIIDGNRNVFANNNVLGNGLRASGRGELHLNSTGENTVSEIFFAYGSGYAGNDNNIRWGISDRGASTGKLSFYKGPKLTGSSFYEIAYFNKLDNKLYLTGGLAVGGLGVIDSARNASFSNLVNTGGAKIEVQNGQDGGTGRGLYIWTSTDSNWVIYMGTAGSGKAADGGTACSGLDGRTSHGIRYRVHDSTSQIGHLFENSSDEALFQIQPDTGNILARGNVTAYASDERLKTNIKPIEQPIQKLMKLRGVEFDWIDGIEKTHGFKPKCKHETGVIAQEVEQVIPDAISPAPFNNEYKTVEHTKIISLLIESVRSQQETIESLTKRIEELENGDN
jgi:hypothetical protein